MNVTELARQLKMTTKELLDKLPEIGFDIGRKAIKIDRNLVEKIIIAVEAERRKKREEASEQQVKEIKFGDDKEGSEKVVKELKIPNVLIVKDLAERMNLPVVKVMAELMKNGILTNLNERIDFTTAAIIAEDLGFKVELEETGSNLVEEQTKNDRLKTVLKESCCGNLPLRAPVVVVMGHVDHGKTKLLDAIRETNVVDGEAGGITQHIGAYQAEVKSNDSAVSNNVANFKEIPRSARDNFSDYRKITFLDTPGHEAFSAMRSRGSKIADVAIIVIAADDGLKPQTLEVINLVQREHLPFIVAINKIDKEGADLDRVKKGLSEINLVPEDWGGNVICVPISAKNKTGIADLLEVVLLLADMEELKADPTLCALGTIIESHVDKGEGPVATVLVQNGTLRVGDLIVVGKVGGKIKALKDFRGVDVKEAGPSMPVKILGLKDIPQVGDVLEVTSDQKKIKEVLKQSGYKKPETPMQIHNVSTEEADAIVSANQLKIILKTDVLGSQEAIVEALGKFVDPEVSVKIIKKGLGNITDADVLEAKGSTAVIIAFSVKNFPSAEVLARDSSVEILYFDIIYKLLEEVERRLKNILKPEVIRTELGVLQVLGIFKTGKKDMIVGGKILQGMIRPKTKAKVLRGGNFIALGDITEVRSGKQIVQEATKGESVGLKFVGEPVILENDTLEIYQEEIRERELKKI